MKTLKAVNTIKPVFTIVSGSTKGGKPCFAILTNLRLSKDDFKKIMADIQLAEGYGFTKHFPEHKAIAGKLITATGITEKLLGDIAGQYEWKAAEQKAAKVTKPAKAITPKQTKQETSIDENEYVQFLAFKAMLSTKK